MVAVNRFLTSLTGSAQAQLLYGPERSLPAIVSGLYDKLDELRRLYNSAIELKKYSTGSLIAEGGSIA